MRMRSPSPVNTKAAAHMHQASQASWRRFIQSVLFGRPYLPRQENAATARRGLAASFTHHPARSSLADGFSTSLGDGIVLMTITILLSKPFALYLPAQFAGYPLHESQVALPEPGICFVTHAAQRAVWAPIREHNRHRHVGAYSRLASHPQVLRRIFASGVVDYVKAATTENPLAVGLIEREAFPFSPPEGSRIPLQHAEDQLVPGELRDEGDVHLQVLPDQGEQAPYLLRRLV